MHTILTRKMLSSFIIRITRLSSSNLALKGYIPIWGIQALQKENLKKSVIETGTSNLMISITMTENHKGYRLRQFKRATKEARKLCHIVSTPTTVNCKLSLWMNTIKNLPVTVEDVNITKKIFGSSYMSSLNDGKSRRHKPTPVRKDLLGVQRNSSWNFVRAIAVHIDTMMEINEFGMLTAIDQIIKYRSLVPIENRNHVEYFCVMFHETLRYYNNAGFVITEIQYEGEYSCVVWWWTRSSRITWTWRWALQMLRIIACWSRAEQWDNQRMHPSCIPMPSIYNAIPRILIHDKATNQAN